MAIYPVLTIVVIAIFAGRNDATRVSNSFCKANQYGTYRVTLQYCDGRNWRNHLQQPGKTVKSILEKSCKDINDKGMSYGDGEYLIDPSGDGKDRAIVVYCDMTSFGGGWTMCYTTDSHVNLKTELTTSTAHGYRGDCNNIPFTQVMFVDEKSKQKSVFTKTGSAIKLIDNYNKKADAYGLWTAQGVATTQYKYQMLICDTTFYKGIHISGYTMDSGKWCYKQCNRWCSDSTSPYFRTSAVSNKHYFGVAFNENGHKPKPNRLISAGIR